MAAAPGKMDAYVMSKPSTVSHRAGLPMIMQPDHGAYDRLRGAWNLTADQRPSGVSLATTVEHVREVVAFANRMDLRIAAQATGHNAAALPELTRTLLLRTGLHDDVVEIDPQARVARVKAGALWRDVVAAAGEHGLAALHGTAPDVGVIGYLLGGGLSFYGRRYGLAANHVRAIEVVTADALPRRVDASHEPELFWALRGGEGSFGVVVAVEIDLMAIPTVYAGTLFWPMSAARDVLRTWTQWTRTAADDITTTLRVLRPRPLPDTPEPLAGSPVIALDGAVLGDRAYGEELLAPLRAAAPATIDTWSQVPAASILRLHGDPEEPSRSIIGTALLDELDDTAIDALLGAVGEDARCPLPSVELRQLGGALARAPYGAGAMADVPAPYALTAVGAPVSPQIGAAATAAIRRVKQAMAPWTSDRLCLSLDASGASARAGFDAGTYERLCAARAAWDPDRRFVSAHHID
jgi:FAD binding domain